jgi:6-phosphogluconolactonase
MDIEVLTDPSAVALRAAALVASEMRAAVAARGRFVGAVSGGRTPRLMLRALAGEDVPWEAVQLFQVDERAAPAGHEDRNLTQLVAALGGVPGLDPSRVHAMPVEDADLRAAAARYAEALRGAAGSPPVLDLVTLGLGPDGHTASLVPGDPVLGVADADVAVTAAPYQGRIRMTLTFPALDRARRVLWVVTGADKAGALARLRAGDPGIPAGRVRADRATVLADAAAATAARPAP